MTIYEIYGREVERHQQALDNFAKTLQLLRDLKSGVVSIDRVQITENGWVLKAIVPAIRPEESPVNGLPVTD